MHASSFHSAQSCMPVYVTITCMRLKRALCFIIVLIAKCTGRWLTLWKYSKGWTTWIKMVFCKWYTFPCYRANQSRGSTRRPPFTTCVKRIVFYVYQSLEIFRCWKISVGNETHKNLLHENILTWIINEVHNKVIYACTCNTGVF